jgi:NAD(P)-dependent dehydrogenase (short-subunit alcohol dehydrogenase family)
MGLLEGKVAIVTGAGRGIGRAVAHRFAREGARLVLCDLGCDPDGEHADPAPVDAVVAAIREAGGEAVGDAGDVGVSGTAERLVQTARETFGRLDCAVASAGVGRDRTLRKTTVADLRRALDVHVQGSLELVQAAADAFTQRGEGGSIVLMTGAEAFFGTARHAVTAASQGAVAGLARAAAVELRRHRIRVNGVAPTARTRLTQELPLFQGVSEASMGPDHVAPLATFLASDRSADVTGEIFGVAGGRIYAFGCRETTGALVEGRPMEPEEIATLFTEITTGT